MGLKKYFMDNEVYGADDVNRTFSHLVTGGVSLFDSTGAFVSELDEAVSETVTAGVDAYNDDSCRVVFENGAYRVMPGVCFMSNGMQLEVDSEGYMLSVSEECESYVYAEYSESKNELGIAVSAEAGGTGTVPLAYINIDGSVEDRRVFAMAKVGLSSVNQYKSASLEVPYYSTYDEAVKNPTVIKVGFAGFCYVYTEHTSVYSSESGMQLYDVSDCKEKQIDVNGTFNTELYVKKQGSELLVYGVRRKGSTTMNKIFLMM